MANPNAYVSFVVLFTFLLSPLVLTHHLPEVVSHPNRYQTQYWPPGIPPEEDDPRPHSLKLLKTFKSSDVKANNMNFRFADPPENIHSDSKDNIVFHPNRYQTQYWPAPIPPEEEEQHRKDYLEFLKTSESSDVKDNNMNDGIESYYHHSNFRFADPPENIHSDSKDNSLQSYKFGQSVVGHPDAEPNYDEDRTEILKRRNDEDETGTHKKKNYKDEIKIINRKNYDENGIGALDKKNYENEIVLSHRKMMKP